MIWNALHAKNYTRRREISNRLPKGEENLSGNLFRFLGCYGFEGLAGLLFCSITQVVTPTTAAPPIPTA
jgi:hypothetical protein